MSGWTWVSTAARMFPHCCRSSLSRPALSPTRGQRRTHPISHRPHDAVLERRRAEQNSIVNRSWLRGLLEAARRTHRRRRARRRNVVAGSERQRCRKSRLVHIAERVTEVVSHGATGQFNAFGSVTVRRREAVRIVAEVGGVHALEL